MRRYFSQQSRLKSTFDSEALANYETFWLPAPEVLRFLWDAQFHLSYRLKFMGWFEFDHLTLPELELLLKDSEAEEKRKQAPAPGKGHTLDTMAKDFELRRKTGKPKEEKPLTAVEQKRAERMAKIQARRQALRRERE